MHLLACSDIFLHLACRLLPPALHGLVTTSDSHSGISMTASAGVDWEYEGPRRSFTDLAAAAWAHMDSEMAAAVDLVSPRMAGLSLMAPMDIDIDMPCDGQGTGGPAAGDGAGAAAPGQPASSQHSQCSSVSAGKVFGQPWMDPSMHWG